MTEPGAERIGSALRRLAADLVAERRRAAALERENRRLKAQLEALSVTPGHEDEAAVDPDTAPHR